MGVGFVKARKRRNYKQRAKRKEQGKKSIEQRGKG
jgi:hypothetical protein